MRRQQIVCVIAGVVAVLAVPATTYWLIGDQSPDDVAVEDLNYYWHPPDWSEHTVASVGRACGVLLLISIAVLAFAARKRWMHPAWLYVVGCLIAAGFVLGVSYRMLTAGGVGALIGAQFVPPFVVIVIVGVVGGAFLIWQHLVRHAEVGTDERHASPMTTAVR